MAMCSMSCHRAGCSPRRKTLNDPVAAAIQSLPPGLAPGSAYRKGWLAYDATVFCLGRIQLGTFGRWLRHAIFNRLRRNNDTSDNRRRQGWLKFTIDFARDRLPLK